MNLLHANDPQSGLPQSSFYAATATPWQVCTPLEGDIQTDICVVGGGYTGLSAALHLAQNGYQVCLLEAKQIGFGASGRNGGQVSTGQRQEQEWLERKVGPDDARKLWDLGLEATALVRQLIDEHHMTDVGYRPGIVQAYRHPRAVRSAHAYAKKLARHYDYEGLKPLDQTALRQIIGSTVYNGGTLDEGAGYLHPLNYALGLGRAAKAAGVQFYENSEVVQIDAQGARPQVRTTGGKVTARFIILACNGYLGQLAPSIAKRVMPINNFMIATEPLGPMAQELLSRPVAVADGNFVVNYWSLSPEGRLLFGGGESYGYRFPDIVKTVSKPLLKIYPQLADVKMDYAWGGTLAITMNRMPCFYRLSHHVLSASGYSGHGVAMATLAGRILAQAIQKQAETFDLFARIPQRVFPGGARLRQPLLACAMIWFALRDKLGI